jgi:hypothetical protein
VVRTSTASSVSEIPFPLPLLCLLSVQHHGTPGAKLGLFGAPGGRTTGAAISSVHDGSAAEQTPGPSPCPATPSVSGLTPDSQKKAALQEALNATPGGAGLGSTQGELRTEAGDVRQAAAGPQRAPAEGEESGSHLVARCLQPGDSSNALPVSWHCCS